MACQGCSQLSTTFNYSAFGLNISSDFECDELALSSSPHNVRFRITSSGLPRGEEAQSDRNSGSLHCSLSASGVADLLVEDGKKIIVTPGARMEISAMRLFVLSVGMGALLQQRLIPVLHASSVATANGAVIFTGPTGSGKSLLAAAFHKRGFRVLTDDIAAIQQAAVLPGLASLRLWEDSLRALEIDSSGLRPIRFWAQKYVLPLGVPYDPSPVGLRKVFLLADSAGQSPSVSLLRGREKFEALTSCIYCPDFLTRMGIEGDYLARIAEVASRTEVAVLARDPDPRRIGEVVDFVNRDVA